MVPARLTAVLTGVNVGRGDGSGGWVGRGVEVGVRVDVGRTRVGDNVTTDSRVDAGSHRVARGVGEGLATLSEDVAEMVAETALSTVARKSNCGVASGCVKHPIKDNAPARKSGIR